MNAMNDLSTTPRVDYQTNPANYQHWALTVNGDVATLVADFNEDGGLRPGYKLKLNSYDLGVDIELYDAVNRIRFEHPQVRVVVMTSAKDRIFCSGANIFMLGVSSHAWKVNFCKFTNETRNGLEDSSGHDGLKFLAAVNGACAGAGLSWACACDLRLCSDTAVFRTAFATAGLSGDFGASWTLPRIVGPAKARELCKAVAFEHEHVPATLTAPPIRSAIPRMADLLNRKVPAAEALRLGLVSEVVPSADLMSRVIELARQIAAGPPLAISRIKQNLNAADSLSFADALDGEAERHARTAMHPDAIEAGSAKSFESVMSSLLSAPLM